LTALLLTGPAAIAEVGGRPGDPEAVRIVRTVHLMGTEMVMTLDGPNRDAALAASEKVLEAVADAERRLSTWTPSSELSRVNAAPFDRAVAITPELAEDLESALRCAHETGEAFSPGIGGLVEAWALRDGGRRPADEELRVAVEAASLDHVRLDDDRVIR
jgi:thiamine biosynthesis lipoprotein ApbE